MANRRIIAIALAIVTLVCIFTACKKQTPKDEISTTSSTIAETKESSIEESTMVENSTQENATEQTKELGQTEKSTEAQTERKTESTTAASRSNPTTTQKAKETETKKETTTRQTPPSTTKAPETTTQKPTTTQSTTKVQTVDINYYINYATEYGKSIGLKYLAEANECWDTPIIIASDNHDSAIKDIKARLNRYKNVDGDEYFCVWAKPYGSNQYELYIGYSN